METPEIGFVIWFGFRILFIALLFIFLISGLDDLVVDAVYYVRLLWRWLFKRKVIKPLTRDQLAAAPEQPIAIMIPAWNESNIIQRMLLNTAGTIDYKNFVIFVGAYPNDQATVLEAEKARDVFPNIEIIITPADGPTNKADCLNWIYQGILLYEKKHSIRFEAFVMHDSEDIIHPLWLKMINHLVPRISFIQLPVFPLDTPWHQFVSGVYKDEFAENHIKDLRVREVLAVTLPSAGVGTALSRSTIEWMAKERKNQIFDITSVTEDYLLGFLLQKMPGKKIVLQQWVKVREKRKRLFSRKEKEVTVRQPVATREFFPTTFGAAVRQKSRWILGISLQGWSKGWTRSAGFNYFLYRDRKGLLTNLVVVLGYVVVLYWAGLFGFNQLRPDAPVPPMLEANEVYHKIGIVVLAIFAWRLLNRVIATTRIYGIGDGLLAIPRLLVGNFINFAASVVAIQRFIQARLTGKVPEWGKTDHAWPDEEQMIRYRRKLGDLLIERRSITAKQLERALEVQREKGGKLGEILVEMGILWEEDVLQALSDQENRQSVEIDPYRNPECRALVPRELAVEQRIYPTECRNGMLILAKEADHAGMTEAELGERLGRTVTFHMTTKADIDFAIRRGYDGHGTAINPDSRLGQYLLDRNVLTPETLRDALRRQKRTNQRLGDILVTMKLITEESMEEHINAFEAANT